LKHYTAFVCLLMIAWSCQQPTAATDQGITYWSSNNGGEIRFSQWAVKQWNEAHPEQPVRFQPIPEGQSSEEILLAAVVAKTTPDIYSNIWQGLVEFYSKSGILVALDTLKGFQEFIHSRCDEATIAEITSSDGHIYQIPWKINPILTIFNAGIVSDMPATYSEYLQAAAAFSRDTNGDGYVDQWFGNTSVKLAWYQRLFNFYALYLAASGGQPLIKDNKANFNNEHGVGVFRFLQALYRNNYFSRQTESAGQDLFVSGQYASKWTGPWEIEYLEQYKRPGFTYDFAPMTVPDKHEGPVYTYGDPKSMVIFNTCKNPQAAFHFIKSMMSPEADLEFLRMTRQLPRRKKMEEVPAFAEFFRQQPKMKVFAEQAAYIKGADVSESLIEVFDIISQEYEACVLYQIKSPEQAIADAAEAVNVLLSTGR
jgi:multiple sugar transport system substrate-binding protein